MSAGKPRDLKANSWEDVSVIIRKAPDGKKIEREEFLSWIKVTLDINGPSQDNLMVKTDGGDLILDKDFAGRLYLKGLLLSDAKTRSKPFKFGYNFVKGHVARDGRQMKDHSEESYMLARIWEGAIRDRGKDVLQYLIDMFKDYPPCRDIRDAQYNFTSFTAKAIWTHLISSGEGGFYYNQKSGDKVESTHTFSYHVFKLTVSSKDSKLIQECLKKQPLKLSEPLWKLLRKFNLVRSPDEQRTHLFRRSPVSQFTPTLFSISVHRAFMAWLALDSRMRNINVSYVQNTYTAIDFLFTAGESLLQINDKWLDFKRVHETASCRISSSMSESSFVPGVFVCDHLIDDLYGLVLVDIADSLNLTKDESMGLVRTLRHAARDMLQQMPRRVESRQPRAHELQITWADFDTGSIIPEYLLNTEYSVQLHRRSTCPLYRSVSQGLHGGLMYLPVLSQLFLTNLI